MDATNHRRDGRCSRWSHGTARTSLFLLTIVPNLLPLRLEGTRPPVGPPTKKTERWQWWRRKNRSLLCFAMNKEHPRFSNRMLSLRILYSNVFFEEKKLFNVAKSNRRAPVALAAQDIAGLSLWTHILEILSSAEKNLYDLTCDVCLRAHRKFEE